MLFQCYADAFFSKDNKQVALKIALLELALQRLPTLPSYYLERAFLMKACGDAYLQATNSLNNGETIKIFLW